MRCSVGSLHLPRDRLGLVSFRTTLVDIRFAKIPTGKSFLGSALAKVILDSQSQRDLKPILVICKTNHALDSFLEDLRSRGITEIVRMGGKDTEDWLKPLRLSEVRSKMKLTRFESDQIKTARTRQHALTREGVGWCDGFSSLTLSWHVFKDYLRARHRAIFDEFEEIERLNHDLQDLRRVKRYYGFGYEYWIRGGDIADIETLLDTVDTLLGEPQTTSVDSFRAKLLANVKENILNASVKPSGIWTMDLDRRRALVGTWVADLNTWSLCDGLAEVHRRHQVAVKLLNHAYQPIDVTCLGSRKFSTPFALYPHLRDLFFLESLLTTTMLVRIVPLKAATS